VSSPTSARRNPVDELAATRPRRGYGGLSGMRETAELEVDPATRGALAADVLQLAHDARGYSRAPTARERAPAAGRARGEYRDY
jgi:hypothetical protein